MNSGLVEVTLLLLFVVQILKISSVLSKVERVVVVGLFANIFHFTTCPFKLVSVALTEHASYFRILLLNILEFFTYLNLCYFLSSPVILFLAQVLLLSDHPVHHVRQRARQEDDWAAGPTPEPASRKLFAYWIKNSLPSFCRIFEKF